jgi:hypothetical protein
MDMLKGINGKISNCILEDSNKILSLYQSARDLQTQKRMVVWPIFEKDFIEKEINEQRQWKLVIEDAIACNWAITFQTKKFGVRKIKTILFIFIASLPIQLFAVKGI